MGLIILAVIFTVAFLVMAIYSRREFRYMDGKGWAMWAGFLALVLLIWSSVIFEW